MSQINLFDMFKQLKIALTPWFVVDIATKVFTCLKRIVMFKKDV